MHENIAYWSNPGDVLLSMTYDWLDPGYVVCVARGFLFMHIAIASYFVESSWDLQFYPLIVLNF